MKQSSPPHLYGAATVETYNMILKWKTVTNRAHIKKVPLIFVAITFTNFDRFS